MRLLPAANHLIHLRNVTTHSRREIEPLPMVNTARACYSLALLACSSPRISSAFLVGSPRIFRASLSTRNMSGETTEQINVASNLESVKQRIKDCSKEGINVRLVAVSKTKPIPLLMQAYDSSHRVFGENYAQELVGKATEMPQDIVWHFIGPLQSNKANLLVKNVKQLVVETVATAKLANKLDKAVEQKDDAEGKLPIYVQVNTSGEESKSGVEPGAATIDLVRHVVENCPNLTLRGLMTIGAPGDTSCFNTLVDCKKETEQELNLENLELSMGMSGDFEAAIQHGATNVRVGSTIFGARDYSNLKK